MPRRKLTEEERAAAKERKKEYMKQYRAKKTVRKSVSKVANYHIKKEKFTEVVDYPNGITMVECVFRDTKYEKDCFIDDRQLYHLKKQLERALCDYQENILVVCENNGIQCFLKKKDNIQEIVTAMEKFFQEKYQAKKGLEETIVQLTKEGEIVATYQSAKEAEEKTGIYKGNIIYCCKGRYGFKSAGGYIWQFKK